MRKDKFVKKWEKARKRGRTFYVLTAAVLVGSGLCIGALINRLTADSNLDLYDLIYFLIVYLIGGIMGGAIGGLLRWSFNENKYSMLADNQLDKQVANSQDKV